MQGMKVTGWARGAGALAVPFDASYTTGRLPNGMRYFVRRNAKPEERIERRLVVRVGSVVEEEGERGLAHLLEHLAFRATRDFDSFALVRLLYQRLRLRAPPRAFPRPR
eukprot:gene14299-2556_t